MTYYSKMTTRAIEYAERRLLEAAGRSLFVEAFSGMVRVEASAGDKLLDILRCRWPRKWRWATKVQDFPVKNGNTVRFRRYKPVST